MSLKIQSCELRDANDFVLRHHRHHKPVVGHRFSISVWDGGLKVGVAICGRPVARAINHHAVVEVTRLCTDGTKGACSTLYAACARASKELGYAKIQTYILDTETGVSLRAAGWTKEADTAGGNWTSISKPNRRQDQPQSPKQRWARILG